MKIKKKSLAIFFGMLVAAIFLYNHKNTAPAQSSIIVKRGTIAEKVIAVGSIVPRHTISIKSTVPGIVGQLYHEEGDYVEQGALLLQVTPAPTPESVAEANEAVQENLAILSQTRSHQKRLEQLLKLKLESPDDYALAVKDVALSQAKLEMAQQKLALIQKGETTIAGKEIKTMVNSPISGYILQRNVDEGDPVVPLTEAQEGTVLLVIANMQDLIFKGSVNEIDVGKISSGMLANISIAALPETKITGTLRKIDLQAIQTQTSTSTAANSSPFNVGFNIELNHLQFPSKTQLRAGYSATAEITVKKIENVLMVPERVLIFKDNKVYVTILRKKRPLLQEVKLGLADGMNAQILSGLTAGEVVLENTNSTTG